MPSVIKHASNKKDAESFDTLELLPKSNWIKWIKPFCLKMRAEFAESGAIFASRSEPDWSVETPALLTKVETAKRAISALQVANSLLETGERPGRSTAQELMDAAEETSLAYVMARKEFETAFTARQKDKMEHNKLRIKMLATMLTLMSEASAAAVTRHTSFAALNDANDALGVFLLAERLHVAPQVAVAGQTGSTMLAWSQINQGSKSYPAHETYYLEQLSTLRYLNKVPADDELVSHFIFGLTGPLVDFRLHLLQNNAFPATLEEAMSRAQLWL
eukprot:gene4041-5161_t